MTKIGTESSDHWSRYAGACLIQIHLHVNSVERTCKWLLKTSYCLIEVATYTGATVVINGGDMTFSSG